jgi:membrane peptidoglycan carboxypeptidase
MRKRGRSPMRNVTALAVCGLLAGIMVAAAVFPVTALAGLTVQNAVHDTPSLPRVLTVDQTPQISYLYASDHKTLISSFYDENRRDVSVNDMSPYITEAIVAAEDMRFYQHHGVDLRGVARALVADQRSGGTAQGASTLTMQYVRQALEYSATTPQQIVDATSDTPQRKVREMKFAVALEKELTKQQILERYLNIAPFGNGAYGIYAAAEVYFNVDPKHLTLDQAALLASLVKAPTAFDPTKRSGESQALQRRTYVLNNMVQMHVITRAQANAANTVRLRLAGKPSPNGCGNVVNNTWGFFCDYFYRWWLDQPAFGTNQYDRAERLKTGGYLIYTSLDVGAQAAASKHIRAQRKGLKASDALMLAAVEPGTGHIAVMAVNRRFSNDQSANGPSTNPAKKSGKGNYPNTTVPLLGSPDADDGGYQFGSTFKMFTMLAALEQGMPLAKTIDTTNPFVSDYVVAPGGPATCDGDHYCPTNDSPTEVGPYNMWTGFGTSVNTYFVPLEEQVGAQNVVQMAKRLGVTFNGDANTPGTDAYLAQNGATWGAFTEGVAAVSPIEMANAYAAIAADGTYCQPLPVLEIHDSDGAKLDAGDPRCQQAVSPDVARAAIDAARCPVGDQGYYGGCHGYETASPTRNVVPREFQIAGKTGTTDNDRTAALIAMTRQLAVAGIAADPDDSDTHGYSHAPVDYAVQHTLADYLRGRTPMDFIKENRQLAFGQS